MSKRLMCRVQCLACVRSHGTLISESMILVSGFLSSILKIRVRSSSLIAGLHRKTQNNKQVVTVPGHQYNYSHIYGGLRIILMTHNYIKETDKYTGVNEFYFEIIPMLSECLSQNSVFLLIDFNYDSKNYNKI